MSERLKSIRERAENRELPLLSDTLFLLALVERYEKALRAIQKNINLNIVSGEDVSAEILHYKMHVDKALEAGERE